METNKRLILHYVVPQPYLKCYTTTESDKKKGICRLPGETFLSLESLKPYEEVKKVEEEKLQVSLCDFMMHNKLRNESCGAVYLVKFLSNMKNYIIKQINKSFVEHEKLTKTLKLEKLILTKIDNPFIYKMKYVFETPANIYFVIDFNQVENLQQRLLKASRLTEDTVRFYGAQIALGIGELHKNNIIHRDIKSDSILLDEKGYISLSNFGLINILEKNQLTHTFCGSVEYTSPEVILGSGHSSQTDWWSFGVLLYEMIYGVKPFISKNKLLLYRQITLEELKLPNSTDSKIEVSKELIDLLRSLLEKNPLNRLGFNADVEDIMRHPFFSSIDIKQLLKKTIEPMYKPDVLEISNQDLERLSETVSDNKEFNEEKDNSKSIQLGKDYIVFLNNL